MSVASLFVLLAVAVGVLAFVVWPLISQPSARGGSDSVAGTIDPALSGLENDYQALLSTVRDLDFDFQTGKLLPEDYRQQRAQLSVQGADLLRQIDQIKTNAVESAIAAQLK